MSLVSLGASVGGAGEDGETAPRRPRQQDGQIPMPSNWESLPLPALVQERERVQERPKNRRLQGEIQSADTPAPRLRLHSDRIHQAELNERVNAYIAPLLTMGIFV